MDILQKYVSLPIAVEVLQYGITNIEELPDGCEEFKWVVKHQYNAYTYNKLAGAGKIENMKYMETIDYNGSIFITERTVLAIVMGTGSKVVYEHIKSSYDDIRYIVGYEYGLILAGITIGNNYTHLQVDFGLDMGNRVSHQNDIILVLIHAGKYDEIGNIYKNTSNRMEILETILLTHDDRHPFDCKRMAKALGLTVGNLNKVLAQTAINAGFRDIYWIYTYKLFDKARSN